MSSEVILRLLEASVPVAVLLAVTLRVRKPLGIPVLPIIGLGLYLFLVLVPLGLLQALGTERLEALLDQWFPEANQDRQSARIGDIPVGSLHLFLMRISWSLPAFGIFLSGLGLFLFSRRRLANTLPQAPTG